MADTEFHIKRYPSLDDELNVHIETFQFPEEDGQPFPETVVEAYFSITQSGEEKALITHENGLIWNDGLKSLTLSVQNGSLAFAGDKFRGNYALVAVYASDRAETLAEGKISIGRVL